MELDKKIIKIQEDLGLSAGGMAKLMKVSVRVYCNKKNEKVKNDSFNEGNYNNLIENLIKYVDNLKKCYEKRKN